jgi:RNA polymerase sigma-70 factor (ECF subfamily)
MIETYVHEGQQAQSAGNLRVAGAKFEAALEVLLRSYHQEIIGFCRQMLGGPQEDIEDVAQEIFLAAWKSFRRFKFEANIRTWLRSIAKNKCLDRIRKIQRTVLSLFDDAPLDLPDLNPLPVELLQDREFIKIVKESLLKLPRRQYTVLSMSFKGKPDKEIAQELEMAEESVRKTRERARNNLWRIIREDNDL